MAFEKGNKIGKTFQPGQTGNPDGRPPGSLSFKSIAEKLLDGKITIEDAEGKRELTRKEKMILNIIKDAVDEKADPNIRLKAVAYLMDRTEGKVPDKLEHSGEGMMPTILTIRYPTEPPQDE
jgi:hypothetical protein